MDRTMRGLLAGIIAGVVMNAWNLFDYYFLHITELRFLDWLAVLLTWARPLNGFETILYLVLQTIVWDGVLGVGFAHLVVSITSENIIYKSTLYSIVLWFTFKVIVNFYHVPVLTAKQSFPGRLSNLLAAILWGLTLGFVLKKLEKPAEL